MAFQQQPQPAIIPDANKIIVIGDLHGDIERIVLTLKMMRLFSDNLEWIAEPKDTIVIQLGDQIDSLSRRFDGKDNWEKYSDIELLVLMDKLDEIAQNASNGKGRVLSLIGNHEIMNMQGMFQYVSPHSMEKTGGIEVRSAIFNPGTDIAQILAKRNVIVKIGPFLFCHGGILPQHLDCVYNNFNTINMCLRKYLLGKEPLSEEEIFIIRDVLCHEHGILWLRKYVELAEHQPDILEAVIDVIRDKTNTLVLFVGHNTMESIKKVAHGKLYFTDAGFSRAYSLHDNYVELIEITKDNTNYNVETVRIFINI
jgi:hypothetical protein